MTTLTGRIDSITQGKINSGPNMGGPYYTVTLVGGQRLTAWSFDAIRNIRAGGEAEFTLETKGKYTHIVDSLPVTDVHADEIDGSVRHVIADNLKEQEGLGYDDKDIPDAPIKKSTNDDVISRQSALKSACNVYQGNVDIDPEVIITMATRFYLYITEGM